MSAKIYKLCFFGASHSGKSTSAKMACDIIRRKSYHNIVHQLDVSSPLHSIQEYAYNQFGIAMSGNHDGEMLQFLAIHFEPYLCSTFLKHAERIELESKYLWKGHDQFIINSDCRNNAYRTLFDCGFKFIEVVSTDEIIRSRLVTRGDMSRFDASKRIESISDIKADYIIQNNGTPEELESQIAEILKDMVK
jgi:chloramphenicol 3-O-phosphotransferase